MTNMAAMPIYGENLKNIIFSETQRLMTLKVGIKHWVLKEYQMCSNNDPGMILTYLRQCQISSLMLLYEKKVKHWIFSETIVYYITVGRCSQLNEYMKLYKYRWSRSFTDLGPNHSESIFLNFFSSITADYNISSALI